MSKSRSDTVGKETSHAASRTPHRASVAFLLALAPAAHGATLYAAANGVDSAGCGAKAAPCRSITRTIANAAPGDKIIVGPGRYDATTETPAPGCGCMLALNKPVSLESSHGAAQTWIDGRESPELTTVLIITIGGTFGKLGKGFTVTQSDGGARGIVIDAEAVAVRGNHVTTITPDVLSTGISTVDSPGSVVIEGNQVTAWATGVAVQGANKTVRGNVVSANINGIAAAPGSTVVGNVSLSNRVGIVLPEGSAVVSGNAVIGNVWGIANATPGGGAPSGGTAFTGEITKNNLIDNGCGTLNVGIVGLSAPANFWGAPTGPGPDPADEACDLLGGTTATARFATKPFKVKPAIKP